LEHIHRKLETLLGAEQAYINAIYYCPHHPDSGYPEERKEYKILCNCRKPNPGMLLQAIKEWNINLAESFMIGDKESDRLAGINAGVKQSILIEQNRPFALLNLIQTLI
jgi:D,D-heptose 1,7-bisphosphate phosphatase